MTNVSSAEDVSIVLIQLKECSSRKLNSPRSHSFFISETSGIVFSGENGALRKSFPERRSVGLKACE